MLGFGGTTGFFMIPRWVLGCHVFFWGTALAFGGTLGVLGEPRFFGVPRWVLGQLLAFWGTTLGFGGATWIFGVPRWVLGSPRCVGASLDALGAPMASNPKHCGLPGGAASIVPN